MRRIFNALDHLASGSVSDDDESVQPMDVGAAFDSDGLSSDGLSSDDAVWQSQPIDCNACTTLAMPEKNEESDVDESDTEDDEISNEDDVGDESVESLFEDTLGDVLDAEALVLKFPQKALDVLEEIVTGKKSEAEKATIEAERAEKEKKKAEEAAKKAQEDAEKAAEAEEQEKAEAAAAQEKAEAEAREAEEAAKAAREAAEAVKAEEDQEKKRKLEKEAKEKAEQAAEAEEKKRVAEEEALKKTKEAEQAARAKKNAENKAATEKAEAEEAAKKAEKAAKEAAAAKEKESEEVVSASSELVGEASDVGSYDSLGDKSDGNPSDVVDAGDDEGVGDGTGGGEKTDDNEDADDGADDDEDVEDKSGSEEKDSRNEKTDQGGNNGVKIETEREKELRDGLEVLSETFAKLQRYNTAFENSKKVNTDAELHKSFIEMAKASDVDVEGMENALGFNRYNQETAETKLRDVNREALKRFDGLSQIDVTYQKYYTFLEKYVPDVKPLVDEMRLLYPPVQIPDFYTEKEVNVLFKQDGSTVPARTEFRPKFIGFSHLQEKAFFTRYLQNRRNNDSVYDAFVYYNNKKLTQDLQNKVTDKEANDYFAGMLKVESTVEGQTVSSLIQNKDFDKLKLVVKKVSGTMETFTKGNIEKFINATGGYGVASDFERSVVNLAKTYLRVRLRKLDASYKKNLNLDGMINLFNEKTNGTGQGGKKTDLSRLDLTKAEFSAASFTASPHHATRLAHEFHFAQFPFSCDTDEPSIDESGDITSNDSLNTASGYLKTRMEALLRTKVAMYRGAAAMRESSAIALDSATNGLVDLALARGVVDAVQAEAGRSALEDANQLSLEEFRYDNENNTPIIQPELERFYANRNNRARAMGDAGAFPLDSDNGTAARAASDMRVIDFLALLFGDRTRAEAEWRRMRAQELAATDALIAGGESEAFTEARAEAVFESYSAGEVVDLEIRRQTEVRIDVFDSALYNEEYVYEDAPEIICPKPVCRPKSVCQPKPVCRPMVACGDAYGEDEARYLEDTDSSSPDDDVMYEPLRHAFGEFNTTVNELSPETRTSLAETIGSSAVAQLVKATGERGDEPHVLSTLCTYMLRALFDAMFKDNCVTMQSLAELRRIQVFFETAAGTPPMSDTAPQSTRSRITATLLSAGEKIFSVANDATPPAAKGAAAQLRMELLEQVMSGPWRDAGAEKFIEVAQGAPLYIADFVRYPDTLIDTLTGLLSGILLALPTLDSFKANFIVSEWDSAAKYTKMMLSRYDSIAPKKTSPKKKKAGKKKAPIVETKPKPVTKAPVTEPQILQSGADLASLFMAAAKRAGPAN